MSMAPIGANTYQARILWTHDARPTYPLAVLSRPGLTFPTWRKMIEKGQIDRNRNALVGVFNAAGCAVAVLLWNGQALELFASAPSLFFDPRVAFAAAESTADELMRASNPS